MTSRARSILVIALALTLAVSAAALAAGPLRGHNYEGGAPAMGVDGEGHRQDTNASGKIVLHVANSGRSVSVRFTSADPVLYCSTQQQLKVQATKPASISKSGGFSATIEQRFAAGPGPPAILQVVTGHFSGHTVKGTIHTKAAECGGVASFSAKTR